MPRSIYSIVKDKWEVFAVAAVLLLAFGLRCYFLAEYRYPLMLHEQDGIAYMQIADDILHFRHLRAGFMPPFYPFVIALFSFLPVSGELAARLASISMDALIVLPIYGLGKRLLNPQAALCACALWACFFLSLFSASSPMAFSTYLFLILAGTFLLYRVLYEEPQYVWVFASGACFAFAYLTRPEGIVGFGCGLMFCALRFLFDRNRKNMGILALYAAGFILFAAPYWVSLHNDLGYWTFTGKTNIAIQGVDGSLLLKNGALPAKGGSGLSLWLEKVGGLAGGVKFVIGNAAGFLGMLPRLFQGWINALALIGICLLLISGHIRKRVILVIPVLVTLPAYIATLPKTPGYIYPLFPVFFIACSWALERMAYILKKGLEKTATGSPYAYHALFGLSALGFVTFFAYDSFGKCIREFESSDIRYQVELSNKIFKESGEFVKHASKPSDMVMTRWGLICYYADRPYMTLPKGNVTEVIDYGKKHGARFLVIDTVSVGTRRQELAELLNPLFGDPIDPGYGILPIRINGYYGLGGYVIYRYTD